MSPLSTSSSGVSRQSLASSRAVQLTTGAVFIAGAILALSGFALLDMPLLRAAPGAVVGVTVGLAVLLRPPPRVGSLWNQLLIAAAWAVPLCAFIGALPHSAPAAPGVVFVAVLVPFRLVDRRQMATHLGLASLVLLAPVVLGLADRPTLVACGVTIVAMLSLAMIVNVVLDAIEEQGIRLETLVRQDPLTGAGNRRLLAERLDYEFARHLRSNQSLVLLAFDLNGFKQINDTLGHAAGDELLIAVARTLRERLRSQDTVIRQGGDEFCVLLPNTDFHKADQIGSELREALRAVDAGGSPLSTGMGIAEFPRDGADTDTLLRVADTRLRVDKQPGTVPG